MAEGFHKVVETVKTHPVLFTAIIGIVAVYFLWPTSTTPATGGADDAEVSAIADASQANASLALAQDQVQISGLNDAASQAMNSNDDATSLGEANLEANVASLNSNNELSALNTTTAASLTALGIQNATQNAVAADVLSSQASAEKWISGLEASHLAVPTNLSTLGATIGNNSAAVQELSMLVGGVGTTPNNNNVTAAVVNTTSTAPK